MRGWQGAGSLSWNEHGGGLQGFEAAEVSGAQAWVELWLVLQLPPTNARACILCWCPGDDLCRSFGNAERTATTAWCSSVASSSCLAGPTCNTQCSIGGNDKFVRQLILSCVHASFLHGPVKPRPRCLPATRLPSRPLSTPPAALPVSCSRVPPFQGALRDSALWPCSGFEGDCNCTCLQSSRPRALGPSAPPAAPSRRREHLDARRSGHHIAACQGCTVLTGGGSRPCPARGKGLQDCSCPSRVQATPAAESATRSVASYKPVSLAADSV